MKLDVAGFLQYFEAGRDHASKPHVMVALSGRFKGETGERWHLMPIVWPLSPPPLGSSAAIAALLVSSATALPLGIGLVAPAPAGSFIFAPAGSSLGIGTAPKPYVLCKKRQTLSKL